MHCELRDLTLSQPWMMNSVYDLQAAVSSAGTQGGVARPSSHAIDVTADSATTCDRKVSLGFCCHITIPCASWAVLSFFMKEM